MKYNTPEIRVLGDASVLIKGTKSGKVDSPNGQTIDCELDD